MSTLLRDCQLWFHSLLFSSVYLIFPLPFVIPLITVFIDSLTDMPVITPCISFLSKTSEHFTFLSFILFTLIAFFYWTSSLHKTNKHPFLNFLPILPPQSPYTELLSVVQDSATLDLISSSLSNLFFFFCFLPLQFVYSSQLSLPSISSISLPDPPFLSPHSWPFSTPVF